MPGVPEAKLCRNTPKLLEYLARLPENTVMVGDYNFPSIRWEEGRGGTEEERRFLALLEERGWEQRVGGSPGPWGATPWTWPLGSPGCWRSLSCSPRSGPRTT